MKLLASLLVVASSITMIYGGIVPNELAEITKGLHIECVAETKVPEAVLVKANAGEFTDQPEFKCYLNCMLEKLNLISDSGEIDYDAMESLVPSSFKAGIKMVNDCRETTGMDKCDKAYNLNMCFYKSNPAEYFLV